jgi:hypothetical protein
MSCGLLSSIQRELQTGETRPGCSDPYREASKTEVPQLTIPASRDLVNCFLLFTYHLLFSKGCLSRCIASLTKNIIAKQAVKPIANMAAPPPFYDTAIGRQKYNDATGPKIRPGGWPMTFEVSCCLSLRCCIKTDMHDSSSMLSSLIIHHLFVEPVGFITRELRTITDIGSTPYHRKRSRCVGPGGKR